MSLRALIKISTEGQMTIKLNVRDNLSRRNDVWPEYLQYNQQPLDYKFLPIDLIWWSWNLYFTVMKYYSIH